jgi:hypothetical protein
MFEMKLSVSPQEHDALDALNDEDLVKMVRDSLAAHRASGASDDLEQADPSSASHGGKSVPTLETVGSRSANQSANDSARAIHRARALDPRLSAADRAQARILANDYEAESRRDAAHAKIVPGLDRL